MASANSADRIPELRSKRAASKRFLAAGADLRSARDAATDAARRISFPGAFLRGDIGMRVLAPVAS